MIGVLQLECCYQIHQDCANGSSTARHYFKLLCMRRNNPLHAGIEFDL